MGVAQTVNVREVSTLTYSSTETQAKFRIE